MSRGHLGATRATLGPPRLLWGHKGHLGATGATWGPPWGHKGTPWGHEGHLRATTAPSDTPQGHLRDSLKMSWGHFGELVELVFKMPPRDVQTHGGTVNASPRWEVAFPATFASGHGGALVRACLEDSQSTTRRQKPFPCELRQQHEG